jgi:PAS domain S-box-containing protein
MREEGSVSGGGSDEGVTSAGILRLLRVASAQSSLLAREGFDAFTCAVRELVPVERMAFLLHEGSDQTHLYASSEGPALLPFGARIPRSAARLGPGSAGDEAVFCDDTREGTDLERAAAGIGNLSYLLVPVRGGPERRVLGDLVLTFGEVGGCRRVPLALVEAIADILAGHVTFALERGRETRFASFVDASSEGLLAWDSGGRVTDVNAAAEALTGLSRGELVGLPIAELLVPVPVPGSTPAHGARVRLRRSEQGAVRWLDVGATVAVVGGDPLVAAHALVRDMREIVRAEKEVESALALARTLEEQHRTLLDNVPLLVFRLDPLTNRLVFLSRHVERMLGVPAEQALETPDFLRAAHITAEGLEAFDASVEKARFGILSLAHEARLQRADGKEIIVRGTIFPVLDAFGEVRMIEGVLDDVSAERTARTRLVQADRLSTLGMLAASVAHEINNPAAFILLGLDMLGRMLREGLESESRKQAAGLVSDMRDSIRRIVDITRDLRMFAGPSAADGARLVFAEVNRTVDGALTLTRGRILERARVIEDLGAVSPVHIEEGRLGQVVVNLLVNAAQAIPKGSGGDHSITVATREESGRVVIRVRDTGGGIAPADMERIWEPFYTTKSADVGTGLGLAISRDIVERAGGTIRAESPPQGAERGTEIIVELPVGGGTTSLSVGAEAPAPARDPAVRVLVVEDESSLAWALHGELAAFHTVEVAENGLRALERIIAEDFDVVLCDLRMPGMGGEELYAEVARREPRKAHAFLFMTGVGFGGNVDVFLRGARRPLLEKPFSLEEVLRAIRRVATESRAAAVTR